MRTDAHYQTRLDHLLGNTTGGLNGNVTLNTLSVFEDNLIDEIWGDAGQDWFVLAGGTNASHANDLEAGEVATAF